MVGGREREKIFGQAWGKSYTVVVILRGKKSFVAGWRDKMIELSFESGKA